MCLSFSHASGIVIIQHSLSFFLTFFHSFFPLFFNIFFSYRLFCFRFVILMACFFFFFFFNCALNIISRMWMGAQTFFVLMLLWLESHYFQLYLKYQGRRYFQINEVFLASYTPTLGLTRKVRLPWFVRNQIPCIVAWLVESKID